KSIRPSSRFGQTLEPQKLTFASPSNASPNLTTSRSGASASTTPTTSLPSLSHKILTNPFNRSHKNPSSTSSSPPPSTLSSIEIQEPTPVIVNNSGRLEVLNNLITGSEDDG